MRGVNDDDDDDYDHFVSGDEFYPKETLTAKTLRTQGMSETAAITQVILGLPGGSSAQGIGIKILLPLQMFQRLLILLSQAHAENTFENLLNEISQIVYLLFWAKQISKKV